MPAQCRGLVIPVTLLFACIATSLSAQIVEVREYHGKQVSCVYSGLRGVAKLCGTEAYARVFTGTVLSSAEVGETDKRLEIIPDEVFAGDSSQAIAIASPACLSTDIQPGDKWLFYLYRAPNKDGLFVTFDGTSKPITEAQDDIAMLRNLGRLTDTGIIIGTIDRLGQSDDVQPAPLANHMVIAKNVKTGEEYSAHTSERGYFKFELPVGRYDVTPAPEYGLVEVEEPLSMMKGSIPVEKHKCWQHDFSVKPAKQAKSDR